MTLLLTLTLHFSLTALAVLIFKTLFKSKLSARIQMWLWVIVLLSFIFPLMPKSSVSVYNYIEYSEPVQTYEHIYKNSAESDSTAKIADVPSNKNNVVELVSDNTDEAVIRESDHKQFILENTIFIIWVIGAAVLFLVFFVSYIIKSQQIRKGLKITDADTLDLLNEIKACLKIKRSLSAIHGETPMLCGIIKPVMVVPYSCDDCEKRFIITHELCHLKHNDVLLIWIAAIFLCLFWFNPVMWICFLSFRKDVEVYCDERVLKITGDRKEYASLLLKTALKRNRFVMGTTSLQNGEKEVERRIKHIAFYKKPATVWILIITVIAVVIGAVFLTNAKEKEDYIYDFNHLRNPGEIYIYGADSDLFNKFKENYDYDYMMNRCFYQNCYTSPAYSDIIHIHDKNSIIYTDDYQLRIGPDFYPLYHDDILALTNPESLSEILKKLGIENGKIYDIAIFDNLDYDTKFCIWVNTNNAEYLIKLYEDGIDLNFDVKLKPIVTKTKKNTDTKDIYISMSGSKIKEFTNRIVGSVMAEIDYADQDKIVFHYLDSLFVYDYVNGKMLHTFDLSKLNCNTHGQGDSGINISVHAGGNVAYLSNYGPEEDTSKLDNYLLDLTKGTAQKEQFAIVKPNTVFKDTHITVKDAKGWFSNTCIIGSDDTVYYLTTETSSMSGLKLCTVINGIITEITAASGRKFPVVTGGITNEYYIFQDRADINYLPELKKSEDHDLAKYMLNEFMKISLPEKSIVTEFRYERYYDYDEFGTHAKDSFMLKAFIPNDDYNTLINQLDSTMSKSRLTDYGIYDDLRHVAGWWRFDPKNLTAIYEKTITFEGYGQRIQYIKAFITKHNDGYLMFFSY